MLNDKLAGDHAPVWEIAVYLAVACDVYGSVFLPRDVLDVILNLIESVLRVFLPTLTMGKTEKWHLLPSHCRYFDNTYIEMFL